MRAARRRLVSIILCAGLAACLVFFLPALRQTPSVYAAEVESEEWREHAGSNAGGPLESFPFDVSGHYRIDYIGRWNHDSSLYDNEDDHQLFQYLRIKLDNIVPNRVSLNFSGRLSAELNGRRDGDDFFADIYDTFKHDADGRIYYLYLDIKDPIFRHSNFRLGRMNSYEAKTVLFDGAKYEQSIDRARLYVQGGLRASHYSSSHKNDNIVGAGIDYRLLPFTHIGYDFLYAEEESIDDEYHSFDIYQGFGSLKTHARFSLLNGDADDLNLYGSYYNSPLDLSLTARYYALFTQRDLNTNEFAALIDVDDFDVDNPATVSVYFPFHLVHLTAYKGFGQKFGTTAGFEIRWMDDSKENNDLNREYERYYAGFEVSDVLLKNLTTSFSVEYWNADGGEDSLAFRVDVEQDVTDRLFLGAGFYYSQYRLRTSFVGGDFKEDIETPEFYARLKYKLRENIELAAKYQVEDESDLGTTHQLRLMCAVDF